MSMYAAQQANGLVGDMGTGTINPAALNSGCKLLSILIIWRKA
jgi:hypothetical protein